MDDSQSNKPLVACHALHGAQPDSIGLRGFWWKQNTSHMEDLTEKAQKLLEAGRAVKKSR